MWPPLNRRTFGRVRQTGRVDGGETRVSKNGLGATWLLIVVVQRPGLSSWRDVSETLRWRVVGDQVFTTRTPGPRGLREESQVVDTESRRLIFGAVVSVSDEGHAPLFAVPPPKKVTSEQTVQTIRLGMTPTWNRESGYTILPISGVPVLPSLRVNHSYMRHGCWDLDHTNMGKMFIHLIPGRQSMVQWVDHLSSRPYSRPRKTGVSGINFGSTATREKLFLRRTGSSTFTSVARTGKRTVVPDLPSGWVTTLVVEVRWWVG